MTSTHEFADAAPDAPAAFDAATPRTQAGGTGIAALITDPRRALIAVDYDGTLAPIVSRPTDAVPAPGAVEALLTLSTRVGSVAVVTGRPVDAVISLGGLDRFAQDKASTGRAAGDGAGLVVLGQYGLQRWDSRTGETTSPDALPGVEAVRAQLPDVLAGAPAGVSVEDKGHALVLHVRRTADPETALAALAPALTRLAEDNGLEAAPGKRVLEMRPPGHDKRRALLEQAQACGARSVLFAGDDLGDLPAFDAVDELRATGVPGLKVCSDSAEAPAAMRDRADLVVPGPDGVVALLELLISRLG
jgi:trehalose 6-phosphate phosphatase